jgi:ribonuclease P protein component
VLKIETLKKRQDFLRVAARGHKFVTPAFVIQAAPNPDKTSEIVRVGYTASRKVGSAVSRNRAKRRLRALVKEVLPSHAQKGQDYVLVARGYILNRDFQRMIDEMHKALNHHKEMVNV